MGLSKSRFVSGLQCYKQLWWRVHEPEAPELTAGAEQQAIFDQGHLVGAKAREHFPGGVLVDAHHGDFDGRIAQTQAALATEAPAIFEAAFSADDVFVAVDVLERTARGWTLVEVKSSTKVKEQYIPDAAIQLHVLRRAGLHVDRVEIMHLNRDCRFPDLGNLFVRADVTDEVESALPHLEGASTALLHMLEGPLPDVATGDHCKTPYPCPFLERCWPVAPLHQVSTPHRNSFIAERQRRAVEENRLIVETSLRDALDAVTYPCAVLDFETVQSAIPVWGGCRPYDQVPVQFSCHVVTGSNDVTSPNAAAGRNTVTHHEWLADPFQDPRPEMATRVVEACRGATVVVAYNASFERTILGQLAEAVPEHAVALADIAARLVDALSLVRDHVYHPDFGGRFSLKSVLPALVPGMGYDGLEIASGGLAALKLRRLMFDADVSLAERERTRAALLQYCAVDTLGVVRLLDRLRAASQSEPRDGAGRRVFDRVVAWLTSLWRQGARTARRSRGPD